MANFASLPTEIVIEIFMQLNYFQLNSAVRPVCRRFNDILSSTSGPLAVKLFRAPDASDNENQKSSASTNEGEEQNEYCFELHPVIANLVIDRQDFKARQVFDTAHNIGVLHPSTCKFIPLASLALYNEFAMLHGIPMDEFFTPDPAVKPPFLRTRDRKSTTENFTVSELVESLIYNPICLRYCRELYFDRSDPPFSDLTDIYNCYTWDSLEIEGRDYGVAYIHLVSGLTRASAEERGQEQSGYCHKGFLYNTSTDNNLKYYARSSASDTATKGRFIQLIYNIDF